MAYLEERLPLKVLSLVGKITRNDKYANLAEVGNILVDKI